MRTAHIVRRYSRAEWGGTESVMTLHGGAVAENRVSPSVANPTLVFYFMQYFLQNRKPQPDLVDENLRTDYMKIRHIVMQNYERFEWLMAQNTVQTYLKGSFHVQELGNPENFLSLLYYHGMLTIVDTVFGAVELKIPNLTIGEFMHMFVVEHISMTLRGGRA